MTAPKASPPLIDDGYRARLAQLCRVFAAHKQRGREQCAEGIIEEIYCVAQEYLERVPSDPFDYCIGGLPGEAHDANLCGCGVDHE